MVRLGSASALAGMAMALALGACSETMGVDPSSRVAEVYTDKNARASNAGNISSLTEVIEKNPRDAVAYNTRGVVYAKLGQFSNAIDDFSHSIELDPRFSGAYTNRALAYRQEKKDDLAMQDFNQAIAVNPNDAAAYLGRGNLLRAQEEFKYMTSQGEREGTLSKVEREMIHNVVDFRAILAKEVMLPIEKARVMSGSGVLPPMR